MILRGPLKRFDIRRHYQNMTEDHNKIIIQIGYLVGTLAWIACIVIAFAMGGERWLNLLILMFASAAGWSAGMLISPFQTEQAQFLGFRKGLSTFVSGFLLAKVDPLFQGAAASNLAANEIFVGRVLIFATTFVICLQVTYVGRRYLRPINAKNSSSVSTGTPSDLAFSNFDPEASPATR